MSKFNNWVPAAVLTLILGGCSGTQAQTPPDGDKPDVQVVMADQTVIYECNPRSFATDHAFAAITAELEDIRALGADVLWLMPVNDPGVVKSIGSPYCIRDYKGLNARYGSEQDLKALVDKAHSLGMKVILDWVANHAAHDHVWIATNPERFVLDANGNLTSPPGTNWSDVAELNYKDAGMREAMTDALVYWMQTVGIDGYRFDYVDGVPADYWQQATDRLRQENPDVILLGETGKNDCLSFGMDINYSWNYCLRLQDLFHGKTTPAKFLETSESELAAIPAGKRTMRYSTNHDVLSEQSLQQLYGGPDAARAAFVAATFSGGIPLLYADAHKEVNGKLSFFNYNTLAADPVKAKKYAAIVKAYKQTADVRSGALRSYSAGGALMFSRTTTAGTLLVVVNPTAAELTVKTPMELSGKQGEDLVEAASERLGATMTLPAYGYLIYRI